LVIVEIFIDFHNQGNLNSSTGRQIFLYNSERRPLRIQTLLLPYLFDCNVYDICTLKDDGLNQSTFNNILKAFVTEKEKGKSCQRGSLTFPFKIESDDQLLRLFEEYP